MQWRRRLLLIAGCSSVLPLHAQSDAAWERLRAGGVVLLLRHAATEPGIGDPPDFRIDDCSTQRNLSQQGREQSRRLGDELRRRNVRVDQVLSSRWCRCVDTARLAFPERDVRVEPALNSFFQDRGTRDRQTAQLARLVAGVRKPNVAVFVTHQVNITALTGEPVSMGEALVVQADRNGAVSVAGRLQF